MDYLEPDHIMKADLYPITEGALFTDQYQLTMSQLYFKLGIHEKMAQFDHFFREYPDYGLHKAGYCINAGLEWLLDWMTQYRFTPREINFLREQKNPSGKPLYDAGFLKWLKNEANFNHLTLYAIPEGRVIHPHEPLTVVHGPLLMAQLLETALLNKLNYQILIATRASRIRQIGKGQLLLEFGARRGHDKGAIAGARAALIGGADYTSNVGISHALGLPPKGTHSHSMVQIFLALGMSELDAFRAFAELYPENCVLLVDTINTLESGLPHAIRVFEEMRARGHKPLGIRLDSGDLAYLSIQAAKMLDKAGFNDVHIVLSNELDELNIWQIITEISKEAPQVGVDPDQLISRLIYGVGTRLITSAGYSALGGVYKLTALKNGEQWQPVLKISESLSKIPNPGNKRVYRLYDYQDKALADYICLDTENPQKAEKIHLHHPIDVSKHRSLQGDRLSRMESLLLTILDRGKLIYDLPDIKAIRQHREKDMESLDFGVKRLVNPHIYHVSISKELWELKMNLIDQVKSNSKNDRSVSHEG